MINLRLSFNYEKQNTTLQPILKKLCEKTPQAGHFIGSIIMETDQK